MIIGWTANAEVYCDDHEPADGEPVFSGAETDCPSHCAECGALVPETLTADGEQYVREKIAAYITDGTGDPSILCQWAGYSMDDLQASRTCYQRIGGTKTHGTLCLEDLLDAAIKTAGEVMDINPALRRQIERAEAARTRGDEHATWALEDLTDAINVALPRGLCYRCREGDSSDIGIFPC